MMGDSKRNSSRYISLHIGVNNADRSRYTGKYVTSLCGCANDARAMADIAVANRFRVMGLLIDDRATFAAVAGWLEYAVTYLQSGDAFLLTFSGHGARMSSCDCFSTGENSKEEDGYDEGFLLYDLVMKDNYIDTYLRRFRAGVRVIFVADCCHSRTIHGFGRNGDEPEHDPAAGTGLINRRMRFESGTRTNAWQKDMYMHFDTYYRNIGRKLKNRNIQADIILLSACDDNQMAADGPEHGLFTKSMLEVLRSGAGGEGIPFTGSYSEFIDAVRPKTGNAQVPEVTPLGPHCDNPAYPFFQGPPFTLNR